MSEMAETFRAMTEHSKKLRLAGRTAGPARLAELGLKFDTSNSGAHLLVHAPGRRINFWPGTGRWHDPGTGAKGFNLKTLEIFLTRQGLLNDSTSTCLATGENSDCGTGPRTAQDSTVSDSEADF